MGRIVALVVGVLIILPAIGLVLSGGALLLAYLVGRDDGYFTGDVGGVETATAAITTEEIDLNLDPGTPGWLVNAIESDVRLRVTDQTGGDDGLFVGIGPADAVDGYLAGVAHEEITDVTDGDLVLRPRAGDEDAPPPIDENFWVATASGPGTQTLNWEASEGQWAVVVMNADGSPGLAADAEVGVEADAVLPLSLILLGLGVVGTALGVALIVFGASGSRHEPLPAAAAGMGGMAGAAGMAGMAGASGMAGATGAGAGVGPTTVGDGAWTSPVTLDAVLDPGLSRWQWLVKWLLAIPHLIVLFFLWVAFVALTVVAGFAILFTGRYPRSLFGFNLGVLRWNWRVNYYAFSGGLGTDRYPPFSLGPEPGYPARLDVVYPERLSRGLVLVKWWLLAIPHYLIVGVLFGGAISFTDENQTNAGPGLVPLLVLVAAVILLFTARYPRALFALIVGFNRWLYRVIAYAALMTDEYPPFRLDQGGTEPSSGPGPAPGPTGPTSTTATEPAPVAEPVRS